MKAISTYLITLIVWVITCTHLMAQERDQNITDTLITQVDSIAASHIIKHGINLGVSRSSFDQGKSLVHHLNIGWSLSLTKSWSISNQLGVLEGSDMKSYNFSSSGRYKQEKYGLGIHLNYSKNPIRSSSSIQLSSYRWMSDKWILSGQLSRIDFVEVPHLWPLKVSSTYVAGKFGLSIGLTQDLANLTGDDPLINFSITHETSKSDVFSIYYSFGSISQPQFQLQLIDLSSHQLSLGGWIRKNITPTLSMTGGWGITKIHNNTNPNSIQSNQIHLSLSYKL